MSATKILILLREMPRLSPPLVASKTGITIQYVRNLLTVMLELQLVETPTRGLYQITSLGEYVLEQITKVRGQL